jgi:hypothetical protein
MKHKPCRTAVGLSRASASWWRNESPMAGVGQTTATVDTVQAKIPIKAMLRD